MKTFSRVLVSGATLFWVASAMAADVAGNWNVEAQGVTIALAFQVDGEKLTGTVNNPQAGPVEIQDGKVSGDAISFHLMRTINGAETKVVWTGTVAGEEIRFKREVAGAAAGAGGAPAELVAKRAP